MRYGGRAHSSTARPALHRSRGWTGVVIVLLAVASLGGLRLRSGAIEAPAGRQAIDPSLVVRAHAVPIAGTLGTLVIRGTLYPGLPGGNMVRIRVGDSSAPAPSAYLTLLVTMPGMRMVPFTAMLPARGGEFSGRVPLPMFGSYTARLTLVRGSLRQQGTAQLSLPLYLGR